MTLEERRIKKAVKKEEKRVNKEQKRVDALERANADRMELNRKGDKLDKRGRDEEWMSQRLDEKRLTDDIRRARQKLFITRDKLVNNLILSNSEYAYLQSKPDTPQRQRELDRCMKKSKNAVFALSVVNDAIDRLDNLPSEYEWRQIVRDITNGYKVVNSISIGADMLTRLAFWYQRAKMDVKGDISTIAMEHYFGKPIDKLLSEGEVEKTAADLLVKDEALVLRNPDDVLEAVKWGSLYNGQVSEFIKLAEDQSTYAVQNGYAPSISNYSNTQEPVLSDQYLSFDNIDDMPSNM